MRDPEAYQYEIDVAEVAEVWRRGSVVGSWLVDLIADAFARSPKLDDFAGRVSDSGEGRWTVLAAVDEGVPASVITAALYERFESRGLGDFTDKILSAMRSEFGGHAEKKDVAACTTSSRVSADADAVAAPGRAATWPRLAQRRGRRPRPVHVRGQRRAHAVGDVRRAGQRGRAVG